MVTESSTITYKIGNERLVKVTEAASRKLASLLGEKGKPNGALRLAVIGGGCSGLQYTMDLVEGPANRDILIARGCRSKERTLRQRFGARLQR